MVGWYARSSIDSMGARDAFPIPLYFISGSSLAFAIEMEIGVRDKKFGIFLFEKFSSTKRGTGGVFYKDFGEKIKAAIKDLSSADKNLRYFIKKSGFQIRGDYFYSTVKPAHFAILYGKPLIEIR